MNWWAIGIAFAAGWGLHWLWLQVVDLIYPGREDLEFRQYLRKEYGGTWRTRKPKQSK